VAGAGPRVGPGRDKVAALGTRSAVREALLISGEVVVAEGGRGRGERTPDPG
jgi:hypothetical protein